MGLTEIVPPTLKRVGVAERGNDGSRGLQPTVGETKARVAERRLKAPIGLIQASLRDARSNRIAVRGLKPPATVIRSLRDYKKLSCDL